MIDPNFKIQFDFKNIFIVFSFFIITMAILFLVTNYDQFIDMPGPEHVPPIVVYLATDEAKDINGQTFHVERGRVGIYSEPVEVKQLFNGGEVWSVDELVDLIPRTLLLGYTNPAPEEPPKEK